MNRVVTQRFGIQTGHHVFHLLKTFFYRFNDRGARLLTVDIIWEQPLSVGPYIFLCEANEE